jgi:hypothetical protein
MMVGIIPTIIQIFRRRPGPAAGGADPAEAEGL